jgi:hypothetical protein
MHKEPLMKLLSVVTMILSFLIFLACNDSENTSTDNDPGDPSNAPHISTLLTDVDSSAPAKTVKICFIHHSTGSAWISASNGGLGTALNANNYYVTESDYGWDAEAGDNLGDRTGTVDWPEWFTDTKMPYVYANNAHYDYTNTISDPTGENDIIMFKSCYPNSEVGSSIDDEKQLYLDLLNYFENHQDKMFVLIMPPPRSRSTAARSPANWPTGWWITKTGG